MLLRLKSEESWENVAVLPQGSQAEHLQHFRRVALDGGLEGGGTCWQINRNQTFSVSSSITHTHVPRRFCIFPERAAFFNAILCCHNV